MPFSEVVLAKSPHSDNTSRSAFNRSATGLFVGPQSHALRLRIALEADNPIVENSGDADTVEQALAFLRGGSFGGTSPFGFIVCDADFDQQALRSLFDEVRSAPSPTVLLLYTHALNATYKTKAVELKADDYLYATLGLHNLVERIHFLVEVKSKVANSAAALPATFRRSWKKRLFDVSVATLLLLILSPLFLLIILLIKLESFGPAFFVAQRVGSNYDVFDFYKFRTMQVGADAQRERLKTLNSYYSTERTASNEPFFFKVKDDPRVTRVGRFLRKTSLDELPQLVNVLKGDMSLVGNRPLPLDEAASLTKDEWAVRFLAPSGMTGLWQISKRKESMTVAERIDLDLRYQNSMSLRTDLKILLKTLPGMLQQD